MTFRSLGAPLLSDDPRSLDAGKLLTSSSLGLVLLLHVLQAAGDFLIAAKELPQGEVVRSHALALAMRGAERAPVEVHGQHLLQGHGESRHRFLVEGEALWEVCFADSLFNCLARWMAGLCSILIYYRRI